MEHGAPVDFRNASMAETLEPASCLSTLLSSPSKIEPMLMVEEVIPLSQMWMQSHAMMSSRRAKAPCLIPGPQRRRVNKSDLSVRGKAFSKSPKQSQTFLPKRDCMAKSSWRASMGASTSLMYPLWPGQRDPWIVGLSRAERTASCSKPICARTVSKR